MAGLLGFVVLGTAFFLNASRPTYACAELFNPTPPPSSVPATQAPSTGVPASTPGASTPTVSAPPLGFVQPDMGQLHTDASGTINYPSCPPASGKHYNAAGVGPIRGGFYGANDPTSPAGWIHNLEHGAIVLLYRCPEGQGEGCTDAGQQALRELLARWPASPYCGTPPGAITPVIARFDEMAWPYAALVWGVILPMQTLDETALFDFYAQRGERFNPEPQCPDPTPTPGPTPTGGPSTSPAASGAASPGTSPAASAASSPAASPTASTAPAPS